MAGQAQLRAYLESGLRAHNSGDIDSAKAAYQKALALAPDNPDALHLLGVALLQLGQPGQAIGCLECAARKLRNNAAVIGNLAQAYFAGERYAESRATFRAASRLDPANVQFQVGIATSLAMQRKFSAAETLLRRLTARFPRASLAWFNLGNVQRDCGRMEEAIESYRSALEIDAQLVEARNSLGNVLHKLLRFEAAEQEFRACIATAPGHLIARCNFASVVIDLGRFDEAAAICREIIRLAPQLPLAHAFLGAALAHQGRSLDALDCHRVAAELAPQDAKTMATYATALTDAGLFMPGLRWFSRALELDPLSNSTREIFGRALLRHGRMAEGWAEFAFRPPLEQFRVKHPEIELSGTLPPDLTGTQVCIVGEQGLGDEIFFLRYVPQLRKRGARIVYRGSTRIRSLLSRVAGVECVLEEDAPLPPNAAVMLAGDLPRALDNFSATPLPVSNGGGIDAGLREFPSCTAVFHPRLPPPLPLLPLDDPIAVVRERLARAGDPPYLGLTWRSGTPPREQQTLVWLLYKEIGIQPLADAVRDFPGTLLALQRKPEAGEIDALSRAAAKPVHDFTDLNEDLEGMLALLASIDEYVGVSNTNMHLRASAGKTACVLVPRPAEWRWMDAGRSSPWFPGFTIYRQSLRGNWSTALTDLKRDLNL